MATIFDNIIGFPASVGVQRAYQWILLLPDLYGIVVSGAIISKWCQSITFHQYDVSEVIELKKGLFTSHFPNKWNIEKITTTFVAPVPDLVTMYFSKWQNLMYDSLGRVPPANTYKRNAYIILQDRSGIPSNVIKLVGIFPTKQPSFSLSYPEEKIVIFQLDFSIDKVQIGIQAVTDMLSDTVSEVGGAIAGIKRAIGF